jgi:Ulp1 family protease
VICTYTYINEENHHDGDEKICHLSKRDLRTLNNKAWIGDMVMTYYLKLYLPKHPSLYVFSSQIFSTLEDQQKQLDVGPCPFYGAITSKFDWLRYRFVFFPIFGSSHWSLAVVEHPIPLPNDPAPTSTVIYHIDSIPNYHRTDHIVDVLMNYFSHESMKKHEARHPDIRSVKKVIPVPPQKNSYDCGVHLMHYAQRIAAFIQSNNMDAVNLKDSVQDLVNGCTAAICTETRRSIRTLITNSPQQV